MKTLILEFSKNLHTSSNKVTEKKSIHILFDLKNYWGLRAGGRITLLSEEVNFLPDKRIYNFFYINLFQLQNKNRKTTTTALNNQRIYSPISEDNTCIAEPNLEVLPLR